MSFICNDELASLPSHRILRQFSKSLDGCLAPRPGTLLIRTTQTFFGAQSGAHLNHKPSHSVGVYGLAKSQDDSGKPLGTRWEAHRGMGLARSYC